MKITYETTRRKATTKTIEVTRKNNHFVDSRGKTYLYRDDDPFQFLRTWGGRNYRTVGRVLKVEE